MILMKITFSADHVEDDIKKEFYPSRCRNQFFTICLLAFILCGNTWALGKHWLHREIATEKYFESQNAILAEVHDKESADLAAGKLNKLRWLPEYADLEPHTPALYDAFCDNTERERISKALFFGSTNLAKALCGEQYRFYLLAEKEPSENILTTIAERLFAEMGNIAEGGPGLTADTSWKVDEFRVMAEGGIPLTDDILWKVDEFSDLIPYQDNLELMPDSLLPNSISWFRKVKTDDEAIYVEYGLKLIFDRNVYTISQWYSAPKVKPASESRIQRPEESYPFPIISILLVMNILWLILELCCFSKINTITHKAY